MIATRGRPGTPNRIPAEGDEHPELGRAELGAAGDHRLSGGNVLPARRTFWPTSTRAHLDAARGGAVSSTPTTESAPAGTAAPVEIPIASPAATGRRAGAPARASPVRPGATGDSARAPAVSAARSAKPSIAELSKAGTGSRLTASSALTRPSARCS